MRHRNSAPFQQITSGVDLINASVLGGVISATPQTQNTKLSGVQFELAEDSAIEIELPASLFSDIDLSIDPAEQLTYSLNTEEDLPFSFDAEQLKLTGDTTGLGLDEEGGRATWSAPLTVTDAAGETASIDIQLVLQRSAASPSLTAVLEPGAAHWDEGSKVPFKELLSLSLPPRSGEVVELVIERTDQSPESLSLSNGLDQDLAPRTDGTWLLRGTAEEINAQLDQLTLRVPGNDHAIGTFGLRTTATSELGNTGLRSEAVSTAIEFSLDPIATAPRWSQLTNEGADEALALSRFTDYLAAEPVDPREQLVYAIQLPDTDQELLVTDRSGELIGTREGNQVLLSKEQWAMAMLRTDAASPQPVELQVLAFSSEPSTGLQAASSSQSLSWQPTPLLNEEPQAVLITPDGVQRSTDITTMRVALAWPEVARSGQLQIDLPLGSAVTLDGVDPQTSEVNGKQRFVFSLQADEAQPLPAQLDLKVASPEIFRGSFEGSLELLSSIRAELPDAGLSAEDYAADQATALARRLAPLDFSWDVAQVAQQPEFGADSDLRFNPSTGAIQIDLRRGSSSSGYRNPAEALTLSVRNIPAGYTLAERVNGEYRAVGATDAFGTMTLFTLPAAETDASAEDMGTFQQLNENNLYLVSLDDDPPPLTSAQSLNLALTARISDQPGGDSRSVAASRQLSLATFSNGQPPKLTNVQRVDPVILDLGGTGLDLTTLDEGVSFAMLPQAEAIPTAWLSADANQGDQRSAAFLVLNDTSNDASSGDVQISSITELLSEFFQADGRQRSFASGSDALASLNTNGDQRLDANDQAWSDLQLWFDDGDAVSEDGELVALGEVLNSVDLGSLETLSEQPSWAAGNAVLRRLSGVNLDAPPSDLALYDVGLQVAPAGSAPLALSVTGPLTLQENGDPTALKLTSAGSDLWQEGQDALTLVRLSGVPDELVPSLGVKDSRGDWLFTWADLNANGGKVEILTSPDWSGGANLQLLISQLQNDGSLKSSALTSLALDVEAIADSPILQVNSTTIREDAPLALSKLLGRAETTDPDGSEALSFELHGLPNGAQIQRRREGVISVLEPQDDGVYRIQPDDVEDLLFIPPGDLDGQLSFQWHAVATEQANASTASTVANVLINVRAVADAPLAPTQAETPPALVEQQTVALSELIQQPLATSGLSDSDGSEQLRLEFKLPSGLDLQSQSDSNWTPLNAQIQADGRQVVVINASDFADLQLADRGVRQSSEAPASLQLAVTRISRESRTGDQARSKTLDFDLLFDRQARPATFTLPDAPSTLEDRGGISLTELLQAKASQAGDQLTYKISGLAEGLSLVDTDGAVQVVPEGTPLTLASLEGWRLQAAEHNAGQFTVDLQVISTPPGQGASAQTNVQRIAFDITAVADTPQLNFSSAGEEPLSIAPNGWLNLSDLGFKLSSPDEDGSERLSLVITALDENGDAKELPSQAQFNVATQKLNEGGWVVQQADLDGVSLYLGEIADDLALRMTARSSDGESIMDGEPTMLTVKANAVVRVPLLEVRGVLEGLEDQPIPLLSQLEGVINAQLRGNGAGQTLELELTNLPEGSQLVKSQSDPDDQERATFTAALNRNEEAELTPRLRLPYNQWSNVYWQAPADQSGAFNFQVQAFSIGSNGKTLSSEVSEVQALITAVNDAPRLINLRDLDAVDEGSTGTWDLRSRFLDVDNEATDLVISARQVANDGSISDLPEWLSLDADGVLRGTPSNTDVGALKLELTAVDPLGQLTSQQISLAVGDVNASPVFNPDALQGWTQQIQDGITTYLRNLNLRDVVQVDLKTAFSDEDLINNDQLSYTVSRDGISWSDAITGVAVINEGTLTLKPEGKDNVGIKTIQLRATDLQGASNIQNLQLTVRNINDPPIVNRDSAALIRAGVWQETVQLKQEQANWQLDLEGLFKDADAGDRVDQIVPTDLPAWLTYTASTSSTGGVLSGKPGNSDVGVKTMQWQALDDAGSTATYRLRLDVQNINDAPERRNNPDLSELGGLINGAPAVDQDAYGRLDLNELFLDPDSPYGDALRYSITEINKDGEALETIPNWIGLSYSSTAAPDASDKFLLEPVLYRVNTDGSTGDQLTPGEINQLTTGTTLRVQVEASDNRNVERKGLITADLDISLSEAISLVKDSAEISNNLPLFRSIESDTSTLLVKAGAIPDAGVGTPIGADGVETLLNFDVQVQDPSQRVLIDLNPGAGDQRDGLIGRNLDVFDQSNSVIHSFASKIYLEALEPENDSVGRYDIVMQATDLSGEQVSQTLSLVIANRNDAPLINDDGEAQSKMLMQWLTEQRFEGEREEKSFSLFSDPDLKFDDNLTYRLIPGSGEQETESLALPNSIKIEQAKDGAVVLDLIPPRGIKSVIEQQFKLLASDRDGLSTESDWFTVAFTPIAEATLLTHGNQEKPLEASQLSNAAKKNTALDLQSALDLNAVTLADPAGDEVVFKLLVEQPQAELSLANSGQSNTSFLKRESINEGTLFTIDLKELTHASGNPTGSLEGLELSIPDNQLQVLPRGLSPEIKTGIPLQIWSETRVQGDSEKNFNVAESDRSTLWVPIENARPVYTQPALTKIDERFFAAESFDPETPLVKLPELFSDVDPAETLQWELETPKSLKGLVKLDSASGQIKLASGIDKITDLPAGSHRLLVRAKDTSGALGDASGIASGSIRLFIAAAEESPAIVKGLNLLTQLAANDVNDLYDKKESERTESEQQVVTILKTLNVEENNRTSFLEKLEKGSLAVLSNNTADKPMVLIDASQNEGALLMDAAIDEAETGVIAASKELLESREIIDTPLGEIEFTIDTQGRDFSIVQLQMEDGGVDMDTLFKTDEDGNPHVFESEIITYSEDDGALEDWLSTLTYGVYNYNLNTDGTQEAITTINSNDSSLATNLLTADPLFDFNELEKIDGSAFLIDLDQNNTVDLINMLLVDQGWFDTRPDVVGLIGDPLIPVSTVQVIAPQRGGGGGGGGEPENNLEKPPTDEIDTITDEPDQSDDINQPEIPNEENFDTPEGIKQPDPVNRPNRPERKGSDDQLARTNPGADNSQINFGSPTLSFNRGPKPTSQSKIAESGERRELDETSNLVVSSSTAVNTSQNGALGSSSPNSNQANNSKNRNQIEKTNNEIIESSFNRLLNGAQNWLSTVQEQTSEALRSVISPLATAEDTSIAAALGMIALPLLTERSTTRLLKAANKDIDLKLARRDPLFNGYWITNNRKGEAILIERKNGKISLKSFKPETNESAQPRGFNPASHALLSQSLKLCRKPGAFIRSLQTLQMELTHTQTTDINWDSWFDHHFKNDNASRSNQQDAATSLDQLRSLIDKATDYEPAFADVLMLRQLIDCNEILGLETKLDEEDLVANEVLDYSDAFARKDTPSKDSQNINAA
ncbi:putative Ig domain-containing protein [Synechococcus sp. YX-04-1]|uniref:putative Ig domain-containing protein n=1 Tax=Synechococcus sp. YX-04-1 TaxID=3062778 RepID=UPI0026E1B0EE|nr:putative Ig domain-containing protein [Synechococcus sp. YX-04-1]